MVREEDHPRPQRARALSPAVARTRRPATPLEPKHFHGANPDVDGARARDRCAKCGIWKWSDPTRAPIESVESCLAALAAELGGFAITGGEPLLFKADVLRLASAARRLGVRMTR